MNAIVKDIAKNAPKLVKASKTSSKQDTHALFLVNVYDNAKKLGEATTAVISLLRSGKIKWSNDKLVGMVADAFKLGRLAGTLGVTREAAKLIVDKKPWSDGKAGDDVRTEAEHKAWRAAVSAWSYVALQAGMPSAQTGKVRAPQMAGARDTSSKDAGKSADASEDLGDIPVPMVTRPQDVAVFALRMADTIRKFENRNAGVKMDAYRTIFDAFVEAVQTQVNTSGDAKAA